MNKVRLGTAIQEGNRRGSRGGSWRPNDTLTRPADSGKDLVTAVIRSVAPPRGDPVLSPKKNPGLFGGSVGRLPRKVAAPRDRNNAKKKIRGRVCAKLGGGRKQKSYLRM